ncbi:WecB/TagA/CpsF family glycosyltransferase [Janibacter melonis]|uniref:WecB/TagA/CpsF family glycosyltransferase n=1 Tax=Janibacter melonis TaxID=262209 RepID=UPI00204406EE|nr:WecB/TagA/CpsF family glycosyltransferase [Janibacter melonis]MCM3553574.1 WecB/TagA/CpsF family glycosyltransferase [Janibacter melonis]
MTGPVAGPVSDHEVDLFGLPVAALTSEQVVARCVAAVERREVLEIGVLNAAKVVSMRRDARLRESLLGCDLLVADGQAVVWASRALGRPLPERVAGIDLFTSLLEVASERRLRVYLLGATAEVLAGVEQVLATRYPGAVLAGSHDGYFAPEQDDEVAREIGRARADLLFVAMPSPRKETFVDAHRDVLAVPVLHGVGGSFDVVSGRTRRAPGWMQRAGLEWAYRLLQEPRRMWRRYLVTNTLFVLLLLRERVRPSAPYRDPRRVA